eukprot:7179950-Ditylum_brightwellii.AAC.1
MIKTPSLASNNDQAFAEKTFGAELMKVDIPGKVTGKRGTSVKHYQKAKRGENQTKLELKTNGKEEERAGENATKSVAQRIKEHGEMVVEAEGGYMTTV